MSENKQIPTAEEFLKDKMGNAFYIVALQGEALVAVVEEYASLISQEKERESFQSGYKRGMKVHDSFIDQLQRDLAWQLEVVVPDMERQLDEKEKRIKELEEELHNERDFNHSSENHLGNAINSWKDKVAELEKEISSLKAKLSEKEGKEAAFAAWVKDNAVWSPKGFYWHKGTIIPTLSDLYKEFQSQNK